MWKNLDIEMENAIGTPHPFLERQQLGYFSQSTLLSVTAWWNPCIIGHIIDQATMDRQYSHDSDVLLQTLIMWWNK